MPEDNEGLIERAREILGRHQNYEGPPDPILVRREDALAAIVEALQGELQEPRYWDRQLGDAGDALDFACDHITDRFEAIGFLEGWREGDVSEWPEYTEWLAVQHHGAEAAALRTAAPQVNEAMDTAMLGNFVMQYEEGAAGFYVDADDAQYVARQVKAALSLGQRIMDEVHNDTSIPTDAACKVYAAIKRANVAAAPQDYCGIEHGNEEEGESK